jgi:hypothetical protein
MPEAAPEAASRCQLTPGRSFGSTGPTSPAHHRRRHPRRRRRPAMARQAALTRPRAGRRPAAGAHHELRRHEHRRQSGVPPALAGRRTGQPLGPNHLSALLNKVGIPIVAARGTTIRQQLLELPAPIVADALGYHDKTTSRFRNETGGPRSRTSLPWRDLPVRFGRGRPSTDGSPAGPPGTFDRLLSVAQSRAEVDWLATSTRPPKGDRRTRTRTLPRRTDQQNPPRLRRPGPAAGLPSWSPPETATTAPRPRRSSASSVRPGRDREGPGPGPTVWSRTRATPPALPGLPASARDRSHDPEAPTSSPVGNGAVNGPAPSTGPPTGGATSSSAAGGVGEQPAVQSRDTQQRGCRRRCWSKASVITARVWSPAAVCAGEARYVCSSS